MPIHLPMEGCLALELCLLCRPFPPVLRALHLQPSSEGRSVLRASPGGLTRFRSSQGRCQSDRATTRNRFCPGGRNREGFWAGRALGLGGKGSWQEGQLALGAGLVPARAPLHPLMSVNKRPCSAWHRLPPHLNGPNESLNSARSASARVLPCQPLPERANGHPCCVPVHRLPAQVQVLHGGSQLEAPHAGQLLAVCAGHQRPIVKPEREASPFLHTAARHNALR